MSESTVMKRAAKPGWRTSEFWITLAGIVIPIVPAIVDEYTATGSIAAAVVAGAYIIARALVKRKEMEVAPLYDAAVGPNITQVRPARKE